MPSIFDWSSTAASNTTVDGTNIAEGCPAGNMNNAARSIMALTRATFASGLQTFLAGSAALPVANGGTALASTPTNGQVLVGNGSNYTLATITQGSGITVTNGAGSITISATGSGGTVTSVDASGGTTGLTFSGGPITGSGTLTLAGALNVVNGGTGSTSASGARTNLGAQATLVSGTNIKTVDGSSLLGSGDLVVVPSGVILLWSGSSGTIPSGWVLCDGNNSTPDLRDRFVVGATSTYAVDATGGSADAINVSHTHTITDPGHQHNLPGSTSSGGINQTQIGVNSTAVNATSASATTGITVDSAGSSGTNANLPPYYALCYIMKT